MPRQPNTIRPASKNLQLPCDIVAQVDMHLWSDLEGRVPHGAWSRLVTSLLNDYLNTVRMIENLEKKADQS